ncbi:DUF6387 family protein [Massilia brevitalea]|uniref:DUF6387 family protein n=1 Tax=Massilia brevitalea TaxID=442526 RepID=UPI00273959CE|nr:DUF6387 family protein [Massilia brevitalea]
MAKPRQASYASTEDLAWFKIENYSAIRGRSSSDFANSEVSAVTYAQWAASIRDRVELLRFLDAMEHEYVLHLFEKIKADPLTHLGFGQNYIGGTHVANTPTVKVITANRVRWLNEAMVRTHADERAAVDVHTASDPNNVFGDFAHVMINLQATDQQIRNDFAKWLSTWRETTPKVTKGDYQNKIRHWAQAQLLPYTDLGLFSKIYGRPISGARKFEMLFPEQSEEEREALRRRLSDMHKLVFTDEMAKIVAHLAESESETGSGES